MVARKPSYTPAPPVPPELTPRLAAIIDVLAGVRTVSAAARSLGLSRNHFQTILHRGLTGLVSAVTKKPGGRPATPDGIVRLQAELTRLKRENARLKTRVESTDRLLSVASGLLHGRIRPAGRQRRKRSASGNHGDRGDDGDADVNRQDTLDGVDEMRRLGLTTEVAAALAGVHASTVRRWRARSEAPQLRRARPVRAAPSRAATVRAQELVRRLHGLIGADALRHSIEGLSRRTAARIKAEALTDMERERKAALTRVTVSAPGVLRGVDAMHLATTRGVRYAFIGADGAVPYRTSLAVGARYDAKLVVQALERDLERHGAPLVIRLDRARMHDVAAVRELLSAHRILMLHGPPHYPAFYGQLERQNREHRAWLTWLECSDSDQLEACLAEMIEAVNALWPRRTLHWRTAAEVWRARPRLVVDRDVLRDEVRDRAKKLAESITIRGQSAELAERLAINQVLERRGYLRQEPGGWC